MTFKITEQHRDEHRRLGFTVFRGLIPGSLLNDMRNSAEQARRVRDREMGADAQRLQPLGKWGDEVDLQPFRDYGELPELREAIDFILGPGKAFAVLDPDKKYPLGMFFEPTEKSRCTAWHRDWRDNISGADVAAWRETRDDPRFWNQYNCALYEDGSTWVVPASHNRDDTDAEVARFPTRPIPTPDLTDAMREAERERACLDYCRSMPGATQLLLNAGDLAFYRNALWHIGNYSPYRKRCTLHETVRDDAWHDWADVQMAAAEQRRNAGERWQNPNAHRAGVAPGVTPGITPGVTS